MDGVIMEATQPESSNDDDHHAADEEEAMKTDQHVDSTEIRNVPNHEPAGNHSKTFERVCWRLLIRDRVTICRAILVTLIAIFGLLIPVSWAVQCPVTQQLYLGDWQKSVSTVTKVQVLLMGRTDDTTAIASIRPCCNPNLPVEWYVRSDTITILVSRAGAKMEPWANFTDKLYFGDVSHNTLMNHSISEVLEGYKLTEATCSGNQTSLLSEASCLAWVMPDPPNLLTPNPFTVALITPFIYAALKFFVLVQELHIPDPPEKRRGRCYCIDDVRVYYFFRTSVVSIVANGMFYIQTTARYVEESAAFCSIAPATAALVIFQLMMLLAFGGYLVAFQYGNFNAFSGCRSYGACCTWLWLNPFTIGCNRQKSAQQELSYVDCSIVCNSDRTISFRRRAYSVFWLFFGFLAFSALGTQFGNLVSLFMVQDVWGALLNLLSSLALFPLALPDVQLIFPEYPTVAIGLVGFGTCGFILTVIEFIIVIAANDSPYCFRTLLNFAHTVDNVDDAREARQFYRKCCLRGRRRGDGVNTQRCNDASDGCGLEGKGEVKHHLDHGISVVNPRYSD